MHVHEFINTDKPLERRYFKINDGAGNQKFGGYLMKNPHVLQHLEPAGTWGALEIRQTLLSAQNSRKAMVQRDSGD